MPPTPLPAASNEGKSCGNAILMQAGWVSLPCSTCVRPLLPHPCLHDGYQGLGWGDWRVLSSQSLLTKVQGQTQGGYRDSW